MCEVNSVRVAIFDHFDSLCHLNKFLSLRQRYSAFKIDLCHLPMLPYFPVSKMKLLSQI